jgi:Uma2 family endonuclease
MAAMPAESFPPHPEHWTLADVLALPEDQGNRVELVDGLVVMSPSPTSRHQRVLTRILVAFVSAAPSEYEALPEVDVVLNEERLLTPISPSSMNRAWTRSTTRARTCGWP